MNSLLSSGSAYGTTDPAESELVAWGQVEAPNGFRVMVFDVPARMDYDPGMIPLFVAVRGADADEISDLWSRFVEGSTVVAPLAQLRDERDAGLARPDDKGRSGRRCHPFSVGVLIAATGPMTPRHRPAAGPPPTATIGP